MNLANTYPVMMIDPPWPKLKGGKRTVRPKQSRSLDYSTLPLTAIQDLLDSTILPKLEIPGAVFLWTIDQFLWDAEFMLKHRGFKLHSRIIWNKLNGPAPAFTVRFSHEYLLWFYRPKLPLINRAVRGKYTDVITEPSQKHSQKPDAAYRLIDSLYPDCARLDVFARRTIEGWDGWGDQYCTLDDDDEPRWRQK